MPIPSRLLLTLAGALLATSIAASIWSGAMGPLLAFAAGSALLVLLDLLWVYATPTPEVSRSLAKALPLGVRTEVRLSLRNVAGRSLKLAVHDHYPASAATEAQPQSLVLPVGATAEIRYALTPHERGRLAFGRTALRLRSPLGFWDARRPAGESGETRVYPNFAALTKYALYATDHRLSQLGVLQRRRRGEGSEFRQLREYREGDTPRQVDWKATARARKLISREYQEERDQQVLLLVDCGRRMAAQDDVLSHFDHVLNAALLLAYVSLRQGDAVGLMTMAAEDPHWFAPRKGRATLNALLETAYDLQTTLRPSDYYVAATTAMQRLRKRALIVVLSNMRDEDDDTLDSALRLLQTRHLVLFASLREHALDEALRTPIIDLAAAQTHAATAEYLQRRELRFGRMTHTGAHCVDVAPSALPLALVNRYLDIKRTGRL